MKGYAKLSVAPQSAEKISKGLKEAGITGIPPEKLHLTLMYDKRNPDIDPGANNKEYFAQVIGVKHLGEKGSKWEAVTLLLSCPELKSRHLVLLAKGYKHSYPDFKPHVSLAYGDTEKLVPEVQKLLKEGKIPKVIKLISEEWKELKDD